jgi:hypothetical protein
MGGNDDKKSLLNNLNGGFLLNNNEQNIINHIKKTGRILKKKPGDVFSKKEYIFHPGALLNHYNLYKEGKSWDYYCKKAGFRTKRKPLRTDEYYFRNLQKAVDELGRLPKAGEKSKFNINYKYTRWPNMTEFVRDAVQRGKVKIEGYTPPPPPPAPEPLWAKHVIAKNVLFYPIDLKPLPVPPVPLNSKRETWIRTNLSGFPYAPHDELGVAALFAVMCSKYLIPWQIVELNGGSGIDCICFHSSKKYEIRVEFKYILSKGDWNHNMNDLDHVVCWENKWPDFPKPVLELKSLLSEIRSR